MVVLGMGQAVSGGCSVTKDDEEPHDDCGLLPAPLHPLVSGQLVPGTAGCYSQSATCPSYPHPDWLSLLVSLVWLSQPLERILQTDPMKKVLESMITTRNRSK